MSNKENQPSGLVFTKVNYWIMLAGIAVLILGFTIMSMETAEYGQGFLGMTLGPIIVFLGFAIEFIAILYKPKKS
ncbi:MAG: DUF3098 domain-containing protein [Cytophagaceae bacterium]|nr:DUF3098 domain-containing protein [Cytophagaceae bacterium]